MNTLLATLCSYLNIKPEYTALLDERDTSDIWRQFAIWLLVDPDDGVLRFTNLGSLQYKAINRVADLYIQDCKDEDAWQEAGARASYAAAAAKAAAYAAWNAGAAGAARASYAAAAAKAAAYAAWNASQAAADATCAAAFMSDSERMANKLIELLQAAPLITTNK